MRAEQLEQLRFDIDAGEAYLDQCVWEGDLAPGDRLKRLGNPTSILIADVLPPPGAEDDSTLVFLTEDGKLYRLVGSRWTRETDRLATSPMTA